MVTEGMKTSGKPEETGTEQKCQKEKYRHLRHRDVTGRYDSVVKRPYSKHSPGSTLPRTGELCYTSNLCHVWAIKTAATPDLQRWYGKLAFSAESHILTL